MKIFISGGAKNGKSGYAQKLAAEIREDIGGHGGKGIVYYVATMVPTDNEDLDRIARHIKDREGLDFTTVEKTRNLSSLPEERRRDSVYLVDSVTALLANVMFPPEGEEQDYWFNPEAPKEVISDLDGFMKKAEHIIFVSDYIYGANCNVFPTVPEGETDYTDCYVRGLAEVDRFLADTCDRVYELSAGIPIRHK